MKSQFSNILKFHSSFEFVFWSLTSLLCSSPTLRKLSFKKKWKNLTLYSHNPELIFLECFECFFLPSLIYKYGKQQALKLNKLHQEQGWPQEKIHQICEQPNNPINNTTNWSMQKQTGQFHTKIVDILLHREGWSSLDLRESSFKRCT